MDTGTPAATVARIETKGAPRVGVSRRWNWPQRDASLDGAERDLARAAGVSAILARLLGQRGVREPAAIQAFLEPALTHLHDPSLLPDIDKAVERLGRAIDAKEPVLLYADYDVDGNSGAAVLSDILGALGAVVSVHVPDRVKDGYGLKVERLRRAAAEGVKVVISIDNGVAALDEARFCREVGLDLIVTDHHTMKETLPEAYAVIHPRVPGSKYPNPHICGAGVAFKLAWAVAQHRGHPTSTGQKRPAPAIRERLLAGLGLVALGTVADVVSLEGENRALVRYGLRALSLGPTAGMRALVGIAETDRSTLDATHIAFQLAPRLNAAGRMGDASRAFRLLVAASDQEAQLLASELDRENSKRRGVQKETTEAARIECERVYGSITPPALVVGGEGWPLGVVGIVAAKLAEEYRRPVLCMAIDGDVAKGSGRSIPGFDLVKVLDSCKGFLDSYGGHAAACGLSLKKDKLEAFREAWTAAAGAELARIADEASLGPRLDIDLEVELREVTQDLIHELSRLEPHGQGNRPPVFGVRGVTLAGEPRPMGRTGDHVSFYVRHRDHALRVVAFSKPEILDLLRARAMGGTNRQPFELAFRPRLNKWNGSVSVELELEDIRFPAA
ncbi:MAG: single-stranded-DNA-specific exonuclease RecJ [Planctomycetota bacterium]